MQRIMLKIVLVENKLKTARKIFAKEEIIRGQGLISDSRQSLLLGILI